MSADVQSDSKELAPVESKLTVKAHAFKNDLEADQGPFKRTATRSRIGKQQSVTGHALIEFGPEQVIVYNEGPVSVVLGYDGQDYVYSAGTFATVPAVVAFVHWGVIALMEADPDSGEERLVFARPKGPGSQYEDRLSGYAPLALWQKDAAGYEQFIKWFDTGVKFKVFRPKTKIQAREWDTLNSKAIS